MAQIRTNDGPWVSVTEHLTADTGGVWMQRLIDLRSYAGQSVQLAFRFHSNGSFGGSGWYVDNLQVETGPLLFDNPEGFEKRWRDWSVIGSVWQIGRPTSGPGSAHTGRCD